MFPTNAAAAASGLGADQERTSLIRATDPPGLFVEDPVLFTILDATGPGPGPDPDPRNIKFDGAFESGTIQDHNDGGGGEPKQDSYRIRTLERDPNTFAISDITLGDPIEVTTLNDHGLSSFEGILINNTDVTQLENRLIRIRNTTNRTFECFEDHPPDSSMKEEGIANSNLGTLPIDGSGFDPYTGGGVVEQYDEQNSGNGTNGPGYNSDVTVERSIILPDHLGGDLVLPRSPNSEFFLNSSIRRDRAYDIFSGNNGENNPRWSGPIPSPFALWDWDVEQWFGMSFYIASQFKTELGKVGQTSHININDWTVNQNIDALGHIMAISTPGGAKNVDFIPGMTPKILIQTYTSDTAISGGFSEWFEIGDFVVDNDYGKWVDIVIRKRSNPFTVDTNPFQDLGIPNSQDKLFGGNDGIFEIWKSHGPVLPDGNREMELRFSVLNGPVGAVPIDMINDGQGVPVQLNYSIRMYKFPWHNQPTTIFDPIYLPMDDVRHGGLVLDGTSYQDVHPTQQVMP